jgi:hypothetical protein
MRDMQSKIRMCDRKYMKSLCETCKLKCAETFDGDTIVTECDYYEEEIDGQSK